MGLVRRVREAGSVAPARVGGYRKPLLDGHEDLRRELIAAKLSTTLLNSDSIHGARHPRWVADHHMGDLAPARLATERRSLRAAEGDRPDLAGQRRHGRVWQRDMDPARFVFLDETGATTNMVCRYDWGPKGERLADAAPNGHWRTAFGVGLRSTGLAASLVTGRPMTREAFRAYVERFLVPALEVGDGVVVDNLATHKVAGVCEAIYAANTRFLARPQSHRAGLLQAESRAAQG